MVDYKEVVALYFRGPFFVFSADAYLLKFEMGLAIHWNFLFFFAIDNLLLMLWICTKHPLPEKIVFCLEKR